MFIYLYSRHTVIDLKPFVFAFISCRVLLSKKKKKKRQGRVQLNIWLGEKSRYYNVLLLYIYILYVRRGRVHKTFFFSISFSAQNLYDFYRIITFTNLQCIMIYTREFLDFYSPFHFPPKKKKNSDNANYNNA